MKEYKAPILSVYDEQGNKVPIPAIKGKDGLNGKDGAQVNDNVTNQTETWSSQKITDELNRPQHNTMRITATKNPLGSGYISDYSSSEIKNWVDAGGDAELYFEDTIEGSGEQIYHYIKFQNRTAYFRRNVLTEGEVRQIDIEIYERNIKFIDLKQKFATPDDIQMLEDSKANYVHKVIASDKVSQLDATEVLTYIDQYDGKLIEFLTNGENPSKAVATGRVFTTTQGDAYLITYNLDGTTTVWNKDNYEKHQIETSSLINAGLVDVDNLTVDVQGDAPHLYSVRDAMNTPNSIKGDGCVFVLPHSLNKQIQYYIDMTTGNQWYRLVTGTDGKHSFDVWQKMGVKTYTDLPDKPKINGVELVGDKPLSEFEGKYELIDTYVYEKDIVDKNITLEKQTITEKPYNFSSVYIQMKVPQAKTNGQLNVTAYSNSKEIGVAVIERFFETARQNEAFVEFFERKKRTLVQYGKRDWPFSANINQTIRIGVSFGTYPITKIVLSPLNSNFPKNTKIEIYGVWNNE